MCIRAGGVRGGGKAEGSMCARMAPPTTVSGTLASSTGRALFEVKMKNTQGCGNTAGDKAKGTG